MTFSLRTEQKHPEINWDEIEEQFDRVEFKTRRDWFSMENHGTYEKVLKRAQQVDGHVREVAAYRRKVKARRGKRTPEELEGRIERMEGQLSTLRREVKQMTDQILYFVTQFHDDMNTWMDRSGMSAYDVHDEDLPKNRRNHMRRSVTFFRDCVIEQGIDAVLSDDNFESLHEKVSDDFMDVVERIEKVCLAFLRIIHDWLKSIVDQVAEQSKDAITIAEQILVDWALNAGDDSSGAVNWSVFVSKVNSEVDEHLTEEDVFDLCKQLHMGGGSPDLSIDHNGLNLWNKMDDGYDDDTVTTHIIMEEDLHRKSDDELKDEYIQLVVGLDLRRFDNPNEERWWSKNSLENLRDDMIEKYQER